MWGCTGAAAVGREGAGKVQWEAEEPVVWPPAAGYASLLVTFTL